MVEQYNEDAALLAGGPGDFGRFYLRHEDAVLAFFLRRTRSSEVSADLLAETFARVLETRGSFDQGRGSAQAWLFGIAKHVLSDSLSSGRVEDAARRRLRLERLAIDDEALARIDQLSGDPALDALEVLSADQRFAIQGRVLHEESYEQLAARLRCSKSVVRQRVSRGLRHLRETLKEELS